jgi:hypothetical protein
MAVRAVLVVCLMLVSAIAGVRAEEQKTTVSFAYTCYDNGGDGFSNLYCNFTFHLKGTINNAMLEKFRLALAEVPTSRKLALSVDIDSPGGSIRTAMEIGRIVRQREMDVSVTPKMSCASACVLVFAAGVERDIYENPFIRLIPAEPRSSEPSGAIGIHRSYIAETPQQPVTLAEVKQYTDRTVAALRSYFQEMNVSERLADDMMAVPPQKIRWLTPFEQEGYGLVGIDPVWQETRDLNAAQKLGLSPVEYMRRRELAIHTCYDTPGAPAGCYDRVLQTGR